MGFSRQEYWSGLPCPPPGGLSNLGIEPTSLSSPALAGGFFTTSATWGAPKCACTQLFWVPYSFFLILLMETFVPGQAPQHRVQVPACLTGPSPSQHGHCWPGHTPPTALRVLTPHERSLHSLGAPAPPRLTFCCLGGHVGQLWPGQPTNPSAVQCAWTWA